MAPKLQPDDKSQILFVAAVIRDLLHAPLNPIVAAALAHCHNTLATLVSKYDPPQPALAPAQDAPSEKTNEPAPAPQPGPTPAQRSAAAVKAAATRKLNAARPTNLPKTLTEDSKPPRAATAADVGSTTNANSKNNAA